MSTSQLIQDLSKLPHLVGSLGLSIAEAQKAFNLEYLYALERVIAQAKSLCGDKTSADGAFNADLKDLILQLLPAKYQYTETELEFSADLAQTMNVAASGGLGVGVGAVSVSASLALAYGYDYRAAARVRTVIHAHPADRAAMTALLGRAKEVSDKALNLPVQHEIDTKIIDTAGKLCEKLTGKTPTAITQS